MKLKTLRALCLCGALQFSIDQESENRDQQDHAKQNQRSDNLVTRKSHRLIAKFTTKKNSIKNCVTFYRKKSHLIEARKKGAMPRANLSDLEEKK